LRIRGAAAELFAEEGFVDTTVAAIARRAGVAAPTVYSVFGSKSGIVVAMLEELEQNADRDAWVGKLMASKDSHEQVRLFARWIRTLFEGGAAILRAAIEARSDAEVAQFADRGDAARREGTRRLTALWATAGSLREGLTAEDAAQRLWLLASVEQFLLATDRLGWSADEYESWLGELLERELLAPA
jgi:AcrR family transcriptional regulator